MLFFSINNLGTSWWRWETTATGEKVGETTVTDEMVGGSYITVRNQWGRFSTCATPSPSPEPHNHYSKHWIKSLWDEGVEELRQNSSANHGTLIKSLQIDFHPQAAFPWIRKGLSDALDHYFIDLPRWKHKLAYPHFKYGSLKTLKAVTSGYQKPYRSTRLHPSAFQRDIAAQDGPLWTVFGTTPL